MKILGIDFTSAPSKRKPICCVQSALEDRTLRVQCVQRWCRFEDFERALQSQGPWLAAIDFPFGQARKFIETIGWPPMWEEYVSYAHSLGRQGFCDALRTYRAKRPPGDKEHRRITDEKAGSVSPQKIENPPVGLMFFEGAPRLLESGVTIPGFRIGDPERIVVEAYPGVVARRLIGRNSYKNDKKSRQTPDQYVARRRILDQILDGALEENYGLKVVAPHEVVDDPSGDQLDGLLCGIQAAWAWKQRDANFGIPETVDKLEGWIADPTLPGPD